MNYCKGVEGMQQSGRKPKKVTYDHYGYFFIAPFFIVFLVFQKYFTRGITMGAVKG